MKRKIITVIVISGLVLIASLLTFGYFGAKTARRTRLHRAAMTAYENKDYISAEPLLLQYVQKYPEAEAEFVTLANLYHEFGNVEMEAQMWQSASSLDPLNPEYRENMLTCAIRSASYALLHGILGRKAIVDDKFTDQELYLYVISSYRAGYPKDGDDIYKKSVEVDSEAFHKNELGRMAEFMAAYENLSDGERDNFLSQAMRSEDPVILFEAMYFAIRRLEQRDDGESENGEEMERLLKKAMAVNYFAGTPLLADFYFSKARFADVIEILDPYLKTIDNPDLYLQYAESCVFACMPDKLGALEGRLRNKTGFLPLIADYCEILLAFSENDGKKLAAAVRRSGRRIDSPLSRFIRLRVAMDNDSFNEIRTVAQEIFSNPPFHDLHNRALFLCLDYISREMKKPETWKDLSQMTDLAKILSVYLHGNRLLTEIILVDQFKKGLVKESDLMSALEEFPDDALLLRVAAEYLILNGKAEQALSVIERISVPMEEARPESDRGTLFLQMLALDQLGRRDEAAVIFRKVLEQSGFDRELLVQFFQFCLTNERVEDLASMADTLDAAKDETLEHFGKFFRAAVLLATGDGEKENEALDLLASTPDDSPDFTFYAANCLCKYNRLDEAEEKYRAILKTFRTPSLPYANLSIVYHAKGEDKKAMEAAKTAFELEKESMLPAFIYAARLSEAKRYEEAVNVLDFPRHAVDYRKEIVALWRDCMYHVIEKSIAERKFLQAENQCKHLLVVVPDDEFGKANLEKVREILFPKKDSDGNEDGESFSDGGAAAAGNSSNRRPSR